MKSVLTGFTVIVVLAGGLFGASTSNAMSEAAVVVGPSDSEILEALAYGSGDLARQLGVEIGADIPVSGGFDLLDYRLKAEEASAELLATERHRLSPVLTDLRSHLDRGCRYDGRCAQRLLSCGHRDSALVGDVESQYCVSHS